MAAKPRAGDRAGARRECPYRGAGGLVMVRLVTAVRLVLAVALGASGASAAPIAWVQMTAAGAEARLITPETACPPALIDDVARPMVQRAAPVEGFPNRVCAVTLPTGAHEISLEGARLKAPARRVSRIVVLGDSGCRLKADAFQACNDPTRWPFARVAALAAARHPDLVVHVGDYYYREDPCPVGNAGCAGSPHGDRWPSWKAELFDPAAPLLAAAPWVFVRGNHENCERGGPGWFRLLDASPAVRVCPAQADTFTVELGGLRLYVVDSNDTGDFLAPAIKVAVFSARLAPIWAARPDEPSWIVTYRPMWNSARLGDLLGDGLVSETQRAAMRGHDARGLNLILSGHIHNFTSLGFAGARPAQLIVGAAGDSLDLDDAPPPAAGRARVDGEMADIFTMGRWGYFVLDRRGGDWVGQFHDLRDRVAATCRLQGRRLACQALPD